MLALLIFVLIVILVALLPIKLAAVLVGAKRTSFFACLIAVILASLLAGLSQAFDVPGGLLSAWLISSIGFMLVLDTTYWRALLISILQALITLLTRFIFDAMLGVAFVSGTPPQGVWL